jgi:hypothetical protein
MTDEKPEFTIQMFRKGDLYHLVLMGDTPDGQLNHRSIFEDKSASASVRRAIDALKRIGTASGSGRKPRGYRKARYFTLG